MIKTLKKLGTKETQLNSVKAVQENPTASIMLNEEIAESIFAKIWNKTGMFTFIIPIQYSTGSLRTISQEKKMKST